MKEDDIKLLSTIEEAKKKFLNADDQQSIAGWESRAKSYLLVDSLKDNKGIKIILETFKAQREAANRILVEKTSTDLPDKQRDNLIFERNLCEKFISLFESAERGLQDLRKEVDNLTTD